MSAIRTLLTNSIDYAGLFPPAELDMGTALENYVRYLTGPSSWALGRFIVPVSRLTEFELGLKRIPGSPVDWPWRLAALLGTNVEADLQQLDAFSRRHINMGAIIDTVEVKATSEKDAAEIIRLVPSSFQTYIEIPIERDPRELIATIGHGGRRAKVRTGGVTPDAFPSTASLARFIHTCVRGSVPFKATAGLHHALRAEYPLTYEADSGKGVMFGFLNLFLATALARKGMAVRDMCAILEESSPAAVRADDGALVWRDQELDRDALARSRESLISFGSCSFTEPIAELQSLRWLEPTVHQA